MRPLSTLDTVGIETPASAAMRAMVAVRDRLGAAIAVRARPGLVGSRCVVVMRSVHLLVATIGPNVAPSSRAAHRHGRNSPASSTPSTMRNVCQNSRPDCQLRRVAPNVPFRQISTPKSILSNSHRAVRWRWTGRMTTQSGPDTTGSTGGRPRRPHDAGREARRSWSASGSVPTRRAPGSPRTSPR